MISDTRKAPKRRVRGFWQRPVVYVMILLAVILAIGGYTKSAHAIGQPNSFNILSIQVYHNLVETDDMLIVAQYEIVYNTTPTELVTDSYLFHVLDSTGAEVGRAAPQIYYSFALNLQNGYGRGITSLYKPAADATGLWLSDMTYRFEGNPGVTFDGGVPAPVVETNETFNTATPTSEELRSDLIVILNNLQFDWDGLTNYTPALIHSAGGTVASAAGQAYLQVAIPGIQQMAPGLFAARIVDIAPTPIPTSDNSFRNTLANRLDGTTLGTGLDAAGTAFGSDGDVARTFLAILVFATIFYFVARKNLFQNDNPQTIGLLTAWGVMVLGAGVGIPPINALAVIALLLTSVIGWTLFYVRS